MQQLLCHSLVLKCIFQQKMFILFIFSVLLFFLYCGLMLFYANVFKKTSCYKPVNSSIALSSFPKISIIIPARNEEKNIGPLLLSIQQQTIATEKFEVIIVDDFSTDRTAAIVQQFAFAKLIQLKNVVGTQHINSYKKKAIETGIAHCNGELIVTTDADCSVPKKWLETIAAFYLQHKPEFIVMPVAINHNNRFIEIFQALDFMGMQGITATMVHHMCNGANLAYTQKAFYAVNGFNGINAIASGDDMLLMHKIAKQFPGEIKYLKSKEVMVQTAPVKSLKEFFQQRIRWASKADQYNEKGIFLALLLVYLFNVLLLVYPIVTLLTGHAKYLTAWVFMIVTKTIAELIFLFPVALFFNKQKLLWLFPLLQPLHIIYIAIAGWLGKFGSYKWKGRMVK